MQKQLFRQIIKESTPALIIVALIDIAAGATLQLNRETWMAIPIILMLVPPISDLGNDVACIISSRITTLLALGLIEPKAERGELLEENLQAVMIMGMLAAVYLGLLNFIIAKGAGLGSVQIWFILSVCGIAVAMLTLLVSVISIGVAFLSWRGGLDPDNVTIPISTSISDVLGIFCLLLATRIVELI